MKRITLEAVRESNSLKTGAEGSKLNIKSERGSITVFVLSCLLVLLMIAITVYVNMSNKVASQQKQIGKIQEEYQIDNTKMDEEYNYNIQLIDDLEVGDTVIYKPRGAYNWTGEYCYYTRLNDIILNSNEEAYKIDEWRVFSIDKSTKKVELVPKTVATGSVTLGGNQGYNNGVKLLNDACNSLYGNKKKGISARNINIKDIENKLTSEALKEAHSYGNYGKKATTPFSIGNIGFPTLYKEERLRVIDGVENKVGLDLSEQNTFINSSNDVYIGAKTIQPYNTCYTLGNLQTNFIEASNGTKFYDLLLPLGKKSRYWISSRELQASDNGAIFYLRYMDGRMGRNYWMV